MRARRHLRVMSQARCDFRSSVDRSRSRNVRKLGHTRAQIGRSSLVRDGPNLGPRLAQMRRQVQARRRMRLSALRATSNSWSSVDRSRSRNVRSFGHTRARNDRSGLHRSRPKLGSSPARTLRLPTLREATRSKGRLSFCGTWDFSLRSGWRSRRPSREDAPTLGSSPCWQSQKCCSTGDFTPEWRIGLSVVHAGSPARTGTNGSGALRRCPMRSADCPSSDAHSRDAGKDLPGIDKRPEHWRPWRGRSEIVQFDKSCGFAGISIPHGNLAAKPALQPCRFRTARRPFRHADQDKNVNPAAYCAFA